MTTLHSTARLTTSSTHGTAPPAPAATRAQPAGWRDPRLVVGVVIVAVCVLAGARILTSADDTTTVWAARHDLARGASIGTDDLTVVRVHLDGSTSARYLPATADIGPDVAPAPGRAAGELLARAARADGDVADVVEVPLSVAPDDLPASVRQGAAVDVWVTPRTGATDGGPARARLALEDVVVVAVPVSEDSLAPRTTQQVIVGVDEARSGDLAQALGLLADGRVVLTRRAGP
jgi:hypothetical protein